MPRRNPSRREPGCSRPAGRCPDPSRRACRTAGGCRACSPPTFEAATADPGRTGWRASHTSPTRPMPTERQEVQDPLRQMSPRLGRHDMLWTGNDRGVLLRDPSRRTDAVEQRELLHLGHLRRDAHLLHRLEVDVRPHDPLGDALVVGRALDHAPAAELGEPPHRRNARCG